jgi:hypothetical protein
MNVPDIFENRFKEIQKAKDDHIFLNNYYVVELDANSNYKKKLIMNLKNDSKKKIPIRLPLFHDEQKLKKIKHEDEHRRNLLTQRKVR